MRFDPFDGDFDDDHEPSVTARIDAGLRAIEGVESLGALGIAIATGGFDDVRSIPLVELSLFSERDGDELAAHLTAIATDLQLATVSDLLACRDVGSWARDHALPELEHQLLEAALELCQDEIYSPIASDRITIRRIPASDRALLAHARAHHVEHALSTRVAELTDIELRTYAAVLARPEVKGRTLRELLIELGRDPLPKWTQTLGERGITRLRAATWRHLELEAEDALLAADAERAREQELHALDDDVARKLDEMLAAAYAVVRKTVPALRDDLEATGNLTIDTLHEPPIAGYSSWSDGAYQVVRLTLSFGGPESPAAACSCTEHRPARCAHVLQAIDALRMKLRTQWADLELTSVLEGIVDPAWVRALRALDQALGRDPKRRESIGWALEAKSGGTCKLDLYPVFVDAETSLVLRAAPLVEADARTDLLAADRAILDMHSIAVEATAKAPRSRAVRRIGDHTLLGRSLLNLAGHPRVFFRSGSGTRLTYTPLEVVAGRLELVLSQDPSAELDGSTIIAARVDGQQASLATLRHRIERERLGPVLVSLDTAARRCRITPIPEVACSIVEALGLLEPRFPPEGQIELLRRLPALAAHLPLRHADSLAIETTADDRPFVRLTPSRCGDAERELELEVAVLVRPIACGPALPPGAGPREVLAVEAANPPRILRACRDLASEAALAERLQDALALPKRTRDAAVWLVTGDRALELLSRIDRRANEIAIEWPRDRKRPRIRRAGPQQLRVSLSSERDWFGLGGEVVVDGVRIALALLLEAARSERRFVWVSPEEWVEISEELRTRLSNLDRFVRETSGRLEVGPESARALVDLQASGAELDATSAWAALHARWTHAQQIAAGPNDPPTALNATLRPYQLEGLRFSRKLAAWGVGGCIADDMGLGKTVQALASILERSGTGPQLVVAPTSVCFNWMRETARFAPSLRVLPHHGLPRGDRSEVLSELGPGDLVITSYGLLVRDADTFAAKRWATLILDEAHYVKNANSRRARAVRKLDSAWRLALTGTPIENHLGELFGLFSAVAPGLLGSWSEFRRTFAGPIERDHDPVRRDALANLIQPFLLRRKKQDVAPELPSKTELTVDVELSPDERRLYDDARIAAAAHLTRIAETVGLEQVGFHVLAALTRLRQIACHPRLAYPDYPAARSSKLARLIELLDEIRAAGHRALVFSQFVTHLDLVREALELERVPYVYLDGETPATERERRVDAFQAGETSLFLISLRAGGTGLNLTSADYVIHLDPWWNPAVEDQATDRAHRIGQTKPVTVVRLIARGTIEEQIMALHTDKRSLVSDLIAGTTSAAPAMTMRDLAALISGGVRSIDDADLAPDCRDVREDDEPARTSEPVAIDPPSTDEMQNEYCRALGIEVPSLEARPENQHESLGQILVIALLERGGPMSVEELAERLAGVAKNHRNMSRSIGRAAVQAPIVRENDGRLALDLGSRDRGWRLLLDQLRRHQSPRAHVREEPEHADDDSIIELDDERGDHVPLANEEIEAAFKDQSMTNVSSARQAVMILDATGGRLPRSEVESRLARLTPHRRPLKTQGWTSGAVRADRTDELVLDTTFPELATIRRTVREQARARRREIRREQRATREHAVLRERWEQAERQEEARARSARRAILHLQTIAARPEIGVIVDLGTRGARVYEAHELERMVRDIGTFDVIAGVAIRESIRALEATVDPTRLLDIVPPKASVVLDGRRTKLTIGGILEATVGRRRSYVDNDDSGNQRAVCEAIDLARLYEYGVLHGYVWLRTADGGEHSINVAWAEPGDVSLQVMFRRAVELGDNLEVVADREASWSEPWAAARVVRVVSFDAWQRTAGISVNGTVEQITLDDVFAARLV